VDDGSTRRVASWSVRLRALLTVLCMCLAASVLSGGPADAAAPAGYPSKITGSTTLRYCTNTNLAGCAGRQSVAVGTYVKMNCYQDDSLATGAYASKRWFYITTSAKVRGFVHSSRVGSQTTVGKCSEHVGIAPARWAAMRQGEINNQSVIVKPTAGDWSGDCWAFAWNAHAMTNGKRGPTGVTANGAYNWYVARGRVSRDFTQTNISIGALVFWNARPGMSVGHVAIYVGNGDVASTVGNDGDRAKVTVAAMKGRWGTPSGWVAPGDVAT